MQSIIFLILLAITIFGWFIMGRMSIYGKALKIARRELEKAETVREMEIIMRFVEETHPRLWTKKKNDKDRQK